jgi:hypothetical protein
MKDKQKLKDIILYAIIVFLCIQSILLTIDNRNLRWEKCQKGASQEIIFLAEKSGFFLTFAPPSFIISLKRKKLK